MYGPLRHVRTLAAVVAVILGVSLCGAVPKAHAVDTTAFINRVTGMAQQAQSLYGVPASVSVAQAILESGWGQSTLATQANAYFGIKCNASATPYATGCYSITTGEYRPDGTYYEVVASFRSYASVADSFLDHGYFLSHSSRYAGAFAYKENPDQFIREVAKAGYATDPNYPSLVIGIMARYNLYAVDWPADPNPTVADPGGFVAVSPTRFLDTRYTGAMSPNSTRDLQITGRNGIPDGATAVALNVTVTEPTQGGYVVAFPKGPTPATSTLNFVAGQTVPNAAVVRIGGGGAITLRNASPGSTQVVVDVTGYYRVGGAQPGVFVAVAPTRVADSRATGGVAAFSDLVVDLSAQAKAALGGGTAGASVVVNVTVTETQAVGYATVYPSDSPLPNASVLNFTRARTVANQSIVRLGADGRIRIRNASAGRSQVVVDLAGFFVGGSVTMKGGYVPLSVPTRILDTRSALGFRGPVGSNASFTLNPHQAAAAAVAMNLTVTEPRTGGYLVAWPADRARPVASQVNYAANETVANFGQIRISSSGLMSIANMSPGTAQIVADVSGYYKA